MKNINEVETILKMHMSETQTRYGVSKMGIFGSFLRGEQKEGSDIDILVVFNKPISLLKLVNMENYLSELLGVKVDLIPREDIRPELKEVILKEVVYI